MANPDDKSAVFAGKIDSKIPGPWTNMGYTYLEMAQVLANRRSKCARAKVGAIVTDMDLRNIEALGYNGPEHGGPNTCRGTGEGACGCIHAEMNAIIKAPYDKGPLVMFTTTSPCPSCALAIRQSRIEWIYYLEPYRLQEGVDLLRERGLIVHHTPFPADW